NPDQFAVFVVKLPDVGLAVTITVFDGAASCAGDRGDRQTGSQGQQQGPRRKNPEIHLNRTERTVKAYRANHRRASESAKLSPMMPATTSSMLAAFMMDIDSLKKITPNMAMSSVPAPAQTAYAMPTSSVFSASASPSNART